MMTFHFGRLLLLSLLSLILLAVPASAKSPIKVGHNSQMYNARYCEYLFVHSADSKLVGDVWNTFGLNKCPADQWEASDATALKAIFPGTLVVKMNGPRFWLLDHATITWDSRIDVRGGTVRQFPGLKMRFLTSVDAPPAAIQAGGIEPYAETIVNRTTSFTFSKRNPLHELVAPDGKRYAMQAYSQIVNKQLTLSKLKGLGSKLDLPAGWKYVTRKLKKDLTLKTKKATIVLQDELQNTYQLER